MSLPVPCRLTLRLSKAVLMPSLGCDANCRHCLFTVAQRKQRMDGRQLGFFAGVIEGLPASIRFVDITGGEPFLDMEALFRLARVCHRAGRPFSVVTNGLWTRKHEPRGVLRRLQRLGLFSVTVSIDRYHRPSLTEDEAVGLLDLLVEQGILAGVKSCGMSMRNFVSHIKKRFRKIGVPIEIQWFSLHRTGSARGLESDVVRSRAARQCLILDSPLIFHDGTVFACCSASIMDFNNDWLVRGSVRTTPIGALLEDARRDFRLMALAAIGPHGLAKLAGKKYDCNITGCENCVRLLNDPSAREEIERRLRTDKQIRKEIVGRFLLLQSSLKDRQCELDEAWQIWLRRRKKDRRNHGRA